MGYFFINSLIKETNFNFYSSTCQTSKAIFNQTYSTASNFFVSARCTLKPEHFLSRTSELHSRMLSQGPNQSCINKNIIKGFQKYPDVLKKYGKTYNEFLQERKHYLSSKKSRSNLNFLFARLVMKNVLITNNKCHFFVL